MLALPRWLAPRVRAGRFYSDRRQAFCGGSLMSMIRVAIVGVGNCASSLFQGLDYYKEGHPSGLMRDSIGGYQVSNIEVVAAFDIDKRKVGQPLGTAIKQPPNCTPQFSRDLTGQGPVVLMGNRLDGVAPHMANYADENTFLPADLPPVD